jgi:hypothetical protein
MPETLLELQDLYNEALVRELIEKTKSGAITWTHLGGTQFQSEEIQNSACVSPVTAPITWDFFLTKSQIGNLSYKYTLDVKKNNVNVVSIVDGPLPYTARDSVSKDLYEMVEIMVLQLDVKLKETIRFVQNLPGCQ